MARTQGMSVSQSSDAALIAPVARAGRLEARLRQLDEMAGLDGVNVS